MEKKNAARLAIALGAISLAVFAAPFFLQGVIRVDELTARRFGGTAVVLAAGGVAAAVFALRGGSRERGSAIAGLLVSLLGAFLGGWQALFALGAVYYRVVHGRPFRRRRGVRMAELASGEEWFDPLEPLGQDLALAERAAVAAKWLEAARMEHASIAAFSSLALDLLAVGAPPHLVAGAHRAALEEIEHARLSFALAAAYSGRSLGPGDFPEALEPVRHAADREAELARIARESLEDGVEGEGAAAEEARRALLEATEEPVRRALAVIARDEASHAELARSIAEWCAAISPARLAPSA